MTFRIYLYFSAIAMDLNSKDLLIILKIKNLQFKVCGVNVV